MSMIHRTLTVGLVAALVGVAVAADDEDTQTVKADALSFKAPATWKKETPKSSMRKAQMKVEPVKGDDDPAELTVFVFPNGAGSVESNIERWEKQFIDADKQTPKAKVEKKKGVNVDVTRVEVSGRFVAAVIARRRRRRTTSRITGSSAPSSRPRTPATSSSSPAPTRPSPMPPRGSTP